MASPAMRQARVLALCQALFTSAISVDLTLTGLVGYTLAPTKALATLPFALHIAGKRLPAVAAGNNRHAPSCCRHAATCRDARLVRPPS